MRKVPGVPAALAWVTGALVLIAPVGPAPAAVAAPSSLPALGTVVTSDLGPGYTVSSEGALNPSEFASSAPDPAAAKSAFATLAQTDSTYERVWGDAGGAHEVQDLLVRFPSVEGARVFLQAAQHTLQSGEIVSSGPVASIPGASRTTYFASTATQSGVGQAVTMRAGVYVDLLSFFSAATADEKPISPADALRVARAQHAAMAAAPGGTGGAGGGAGGVHRGVSPTSIGWAVLAVAVLAAAVATPAVLRRRRAAHSATG